jgi:hypothetical protein
VGLELPPGAAKSPTRLSDFLDGIGNEWVVESLVLNPEDTPGNEGRVNLTATLLRDPTDGLARRLISEWDLAKGGVPLLMQWEWAVAKNGKVAPLRATRGVTVKWLEYRLLPTGAWAPKRMVQESFSDAHLVDIGGKIHFLEENGVVVKDPKGYPIPDLDRHPTRRYVTEREEWDVVTIRTDASPNPALFDTKYDTGTVVQNELSPRVEVYQLLGDSPALTNTMRQMLEPPEPSPPEAPHGTGIKRLIVVNLAVLAGVIALFAVIWWRRRPADKSSGAR